MSAWVAELVRPAMIIISSRRASIEEKNNTYIISGTRMGVESGRGIYCSLDGWMDGWMDRLFGLK